MATVQTKRKNLPTATFPFPEGKLSLQASIRFPSGEAGNRKGPAVHFPSPQKWPLNSLAKDTGREATPGGQHQLSGGAARARG